MNSSRGFTLVEIAVALAIIALLSVGAIGALQMAIMRTRIAETREALQAAREAVTAYAVANRSLPCPAAAGADGLEQSRAGGSCTTTRGLLPWATLGVRGVDGWGNRIGYMVSPALVKAPADRIRLENTGDIQIVLRDAAGNEISAATSAAVAFALWSHGQNGRGATTLADTLVADDSTTNSDEDANTSQADASAARRLYAREGSTSSATAGGEFDDMVEWESRFVLFGRMITAGQLP